MEMLTALLNPLIIFTIYHPEVLIPKKHFFKKLKASRVLDDLTADLALMSLLHDSVGVPALLPKTFFTQKCNHVKGVLRLTMCKKQSNAADTCWSSSLWASKGLFACTKLCPLPLQPDLCHKFLDALASLAFKLSVSESVTHTFSDLQSIQSL